MKKTISEILIEWAFKLNPNPVIKQELDNANKRISELYKAIGTNNTKELTHIKCIYHLNVEAEKALFFGDAFSSGEGLSEIRYVDPQINKDEVLMTPTEIKEKYNIDLNKTETDGTDS